MRVSKALHAIGEKLQYLSFLPMENLHNIVTFQTCITRWCSVMSRKLPNIKCFTYVFPCDFARKKNEVENLMIYLALVLYLQVLIYGTGGMILQNMKELLQVNSGHNITGS